MKEHRLKIQEKYFTDIMAFEKKFELRKNDRDYKVGDLLCLSAYQGEKPLGKYIEARITYILKDVPGLQDGYAILGFKELKQK